MGEEVKMAETATAAAAAASTRTPHFVLVHGIGGGAWCWYKIRTLMESSGYTVSCLDLTGAGIDPTDPNTVLTMDDYNKPLLDFLSTLPDDKQVILVGHSAGGLCVTQASGKFPGKIGVAVYVAATMLKHGLETDQDLKDGAPDLSGFGDVNDLTFGLGPDKPPTSAIIKQEFQRNIIYHMSPLEDSTLAAMLVKPGPLTALLTAKFPKEDDEGVESVRRVFIKTAQDRVVKPEQQDAMIARWAPVEVFTLDSDHSPFFSAPFLLCGLLVKVAASL